MISPETFFADLAVNLAAEIVTRGADHLRDAAFGDDETRALRRAWEEAFRAMLDDVAADLDEEQVHLLDDLFHDFVRADGVADALLDLALADREPDLALLRERFNALGYDSATLKVDFGAALTALTRGLTDALLDTAMEPDSPLYNQVSLGRLRVLQGLLAEQGRTLEQIKNQLQQLDSGGRTVYNLFIQQAQGVAIGDQAIAQVDPGLRPLLERVLETLNKIAATRAQPSSFETEPMASREDIRTFVKKFEQNYLQRDFGGRQESFAHLDQWLEQEEKRAAILSAPAGLGKSALAVQWVSRLRQRDEIDVAYHPINRRFKTDRRKDVLQSLVSQLVDIYKEEPDANSLQAKLSELLLEPPDLERPLVVVIDGLDELDTMPDEGIELPLPASGIHLLVTARTAVEDPNQDAAYWRRMLKWEFAPSDYFQIDPLTKSDVEDVIRQKGLVGISEDNLDPLIDKLLHLSEGHPLLINLYLQRLEDNSDITVEEFLQREIQPGFRCYIKDAESQLKEDEAYDENLLGLLSVALGPLRVEDLREVGVQMSGDELARITRESRGLIIGSGKQYGFALSHPKLGYVYVEDLPNDIDDYQARFVEYGQRVFQKLTQGDLGHGEVPAYVLDYYAKHLLKSQEEDVEEHLFALVCEDWMQAHFSNSGSYDRFLSDVKNVWKKADEILLYDTRFRDEVARVMGIQVKCALCYSTVASLSAKLPPHLPALLVRDDGEWEQERAYAYINRIPSLINRVRARLALLQTRGLNSILPERDQQILVQQILNDLAKLTRKKDEELRSRLLLQLMPYVKELGVPDQIEKAVRQIRSFRTPEWRTRLLGHMVKLVPQQEQSDLLAEVFRDYVEISFSYDKAKALQPYILDAIAQNLPHGAISPALDSAFSVKHLDKGRERSEILDNKRGLLKALSVHVPNRVADDFFEVCLEFIWHTSFANAVTIALAPKLSKQGIERALNVLAPEARSHGLHGHLRFSHDRPRNILITSLIALAHFCQVPALKEEIGEEIEEILDEIPDRQRQGEYEIKYRTIVTLYEITFNKCSDAKAASLVYENKIEIGAYGRGSHLFCILGPKTMKAVVDKLNQKHDLGGRSVGIGIRSSPYFLSRVADQLADRDLNLVMEIAGEGEHRDYEKWGRMRAISRVADKASNIQRQRFLEYIVKDGPTAWCYDSRLEALRSLASSMSLEFARDLVWTEEIPIGRRSRWARWMLPEGLVDRLDENVIHELIRIVREKLEILYNADLAQSLVVLAANSEREERLRTWDFIKRQSSFINDIPKQKEAIEMLLWHLQGEQSRRWRASIRQQARETIRRFDASLFRYGEDRTELVDNRPGISLYRPTILRYLSFGERVQRTYDLRKKGDSLAGSYHSLVWRGFSFWIAVTESIALRKLVRLIFFVGWGVYLWIAKLMPDWAKRLWGRLPEEKSPNFNVPD